MFIVTEYAALICQYDHFQKKNNSFTPPRVQGCVKGKSICLHIVVAVCRDPAYSGSKAYAELGYIYSL